jgi:hypothetical protein
VKQIIGSSGDRVIKNSLHYYFFWTFRFFANFMVLIRQPAPKGAFDSGKLAVSLKRYPDTKLGFFGSL